MRLANLGNLESAGLVSLVSAEPELEYAFRHSLTHEAVYSSLTRAERKLLHRQVGFVLEELYANRLDEMAPVLAGHFFEAGEAALAFEYYLRAGKSAQQKYANEEAGMLYCKALEILLALPAGYGIDNDQVIDLYLRLGRVLELAGKYREAIGHYLEMEQNALQRGNLHQQLASLVARLTIMSTPTIFLDPESARQISEQALKISRQLGDRVTESKILWNVMLFNFFERRIPEARQAGEASLAIARELNLTEQLAYTLNGLGSFVYQIENDGVGSIPALEEAEKLWRQLENIPMLADTLTSISTTHFSRGDFKKALPLMEEAYRLSDSIGNLWGKAYSIGATGFLYSQMGHMTEALNRLKKAAEYASQSGFEAMMTMSLCMSSYLHTILGDNDQGFELASRAVRHSESNTPFWSPLAWVVMAYVNIFKGNLDDGQELLKRAASVQMEGETYEFSPIFHIACCELDIARKEFTHLLDYSNSYLAYIYSHKLQAFLPSGLYYRGRALASLGQLDEATASWLESDAKARQLGILYDQWLASSALAGLKTPDPGVQGERVKRAMQALEAFAAQIKDPVLKKKFMSKPDVVEFVRRLE